MQYAGVLCDACVIYGSFLVWKAIYLKNYYKHVPEGSTAIITNNKGERYITTDKDVYGIPKRTKAKVIRTSDNFEVKLRQSTKDRQVINLTMNVSAKTTDVLKAFDIIGPGIVEAVKVILGRDINLACKEINSKSVSKSQLKSEIQELLTKYSLDPIKRFGIEVKTDIIEATYDEPLKYRVLPQLII